MSPRLRTGLIWLGIGAGFLGIAMGARGYALGLPVLALAIAGLLLLTPRNEPILAFAVGCVLCMAVISIFGLRARSENDAGHAYKAYRAMIGCKNADMYAATGKFIRTPPSPEDVQRCSDDETPSDAYRFLFELERQKDGASR